MSRLFGEGLFIWVLDNSCGGREKGLLRRSLGLRWSEALVVSLVRVLNLTFFFCFFFSNTNSLRG